MQLEKAIQKSLEPENIVRLQNLDLRKPQGRVVIGEHERVFTPYDIDDVVVYLPTGITRNEPNCSWRVYLERDRETIIEYFRDVDHAGPLSSLKEGWVYLVSLLKEYPYTGKKKPRGAPQKIVTGMKGVSIKRRGQQAKRISVVDIYVTQYVNKHCKYVKIRSLGPETAQKELDEAFREAYGLRRYVDFCRLQGGPLTRVYNVSDVPSEFFNFPLPVRYRPKDLFLREFPTPYESV